MRFRDWLSVMSKSVAQHVTGTDASTAVVRLPAASRCAARGSGRACAAARKCEGDGARGRKISSWISKPIKSRAPAGGARARVSPRTAVGYEEPPVPAQCDFGGFVGAVSAPEVPLAIDTCGRKGSVAATTLPTFISLACLICALLFRCSGLPQTPAAQLDKSSGRRVP